MKYKASIDFTTQKAQAKAAFKTLVKFFDDHFKFRKEACKGHKLGRDDYHLLVMA